MKTPSFFWKCAGVSLAAVVMSTGVGAQAPSKVLDDPILVKNDKVEVRKSDFNAAMLYMIPEDGRTAFAENNQNVIKFLADVLRNKTLAAQAQASNLDKTPEGAALLKANTMIFYANLQRDKNNKEFEKAFEAKKSDFEARARELYTLEKKNFVKPAEVKASHILFEEKKYKEEEGRARATAVRQELQKGADFLEQLKKEAGDDEKAKLGELGWFSADRMVPEFSKAAFELEKEGDISEPVKTVFGWHLIRLEGKKAAEQMTYEEAQPLIIGELKQQFLAEHRQKTALAIDDDPSVTLNKEAIDALLAAGAPDAKAKVTEEQIKKTLSGK